MSQGVRDFQCVPQVEEVDVTRTGAEVSKLASTAPTVTQRQKTLERVRRHRALKKQKASIEFIRTDASLFLYPTRLSQRAAAPKAKLRRMALKELVQTGGGAS